jgi:O-antigen ligase
VFRVLFFILLFGTLDISNWNIIGFNGFSLSFLRVAEFSIILVFFMGLTINRNMRALREFVVWLILSLFIILIQVFFIGRWQWTFLNFYLFIPFFILLGKEIKATHGDLVKCSNFFLGFLMINILISGYEFFTFQNILGTTDFRFDGFYFPPFFMGTRTDALYVNTETYFIMLSFGLMLSLWLLKNTRKKRYLVISGIILGANLFCFFKTAIIAQIVILTYYVLYQSRGGGKRKFISLYFGFSVLVSILLMFFSTNIFRDQVDVSANTRLGGYFKAASAIQHNPLLGFGDNFIEFTSAISYSSSGFNGNNYPHNFLLEILLEGGLVVLCYLFYYLLIMFKLIKQLNKKTTDNVQKSYLQLSRIFAISYFFIMGLFFGIWALFWVNIFIVFMVSCGTKIVTSSKHKLINNSTAL